MTKDIQQPAEKMSQAQVARVGFATLPVELKIEIFKLLLPSGPRSVQMMTDRWDLEEQQKRRAWRLDCVTPGAEDSNTSFRGLLGTCLLSREIALAKGYTRIGGNRSCPKPFYFDLDRDTLEFGIDIAMVPARVHDHLPASFCENLKHVRLLYGIPRHFPSQYPPAIYWDVPERRREQLDGVYGLLHGVLSFRVGPLREFTGLQTLSIQKDPGWTTPSDYLEVIEHMSALLDWFQFDEMGFQMPTTWQFEDFPDMEGDIFRYFAFSSSNFAGPNPWNYSFVLRGGICTLR
ncbi:hypothetical protein PVAG01_07439 [Phlyctema vagabunda]|uniref:2EXR domain-containing protein n=1 Tax=Phlyctema vagabunda TaxID=108571 RepID=A0ABR4PCG8_9HELO